MTSGKCQPDPQENVRRVINRLPIRVSCSAGESTSSEQNHFVLLLLLLSLLRLPGAASYY